MPTVVMVVAMEEPAFLATVEWRVGGIQVESDLAEHPLMCLHKEFHQQLIDGAGGAADLLVAILCGAFLGGVFETVQSTFAGQCLPFITGTF
jgi:hypothetical protein